MLGAGLALAVLSGGLAPAAGADQTSSAPSPATAALTAGEAPAGALDHLVLGDPASEAGHEFTGDGSSIVDGEDGHTARTAEPTDPPSRNLTDLTFEMAVDPAEQNYFSLTLFGGDASAFKTAVLVDGELVQYLNGGDYQALDVATQGGLPGRFFRATAMLPLVSTQSHERVQVTLRTYHPSTAGTATASSRPYYAVTTHLEPALLPSASDGFDTDHAVTTQAREPLEPAQQQAKIDAYRTQQVTDFEDLTAKADSAETAVLSITRYSDELRFYAECLHQDWCPASTSSEKRAAIDRILRSIDNYTRQYYGDVRSLASGGHQSDWGGYYGALGEALYIVEPLLADPDVMGTDVFEAFLDEPFTTGTADSPNSIVGLDLDGGELTRREAYERVLKANFDFARSRLSYISNQVYYTYEGAWKAHEGLRVIGSDHFEGTARSHQILGEALGLRPFLGEEVLVGPDGGDLDLYHSLFYHDGSAQLTDDYLQVVMRGLATSKRDADGDVVRRLPYGTHYPSITPAGMYRENGYVGSYGETPNYYPSWFWRLAGHPADAEIRDELLKLALRNLHARGQTRYQGTDADGNRVMTMDQVVDWRNNAYPGKVAYSTEPNTPQIFAYAGLEKYLAEHAKDYAGDEWEPYWEYAREATGWLQQALVDNQVFPSFDKILSQRNYDLRLSEEYAFVTGGRAEYESLGKAAAGRVLPHTDLARYRDDELAALGVERDATPDFAWVDVDNLFVTFRDGDTQVTGTLNYRNMGVTSAARLHARTPHAAQHAQVRTESVVTSSETFLRPHSVEMDIIQDRYTVPGEQILAMTGELSPVSLQPGVGPMNRDNFAVDTPFSSYPDLVTARYGDYLIAVNTTRDAYENAASHTVELPAAVTGRVRDLVSGKAVKVRGGTVTLKPSSAVVLDLGTPASTSRPSQVLAIDATVGAGAGGTDAAALTWGRSAGATSFDVVRGTSSDLDDGVVVAEGVTGQSVVDEVPAPGTYYYSVVARNDAGAAPAAQPVIVEVRPASAGLSGAGWRGDQVGETGGTVTREGDSITVSGASGAGFAGGDEAITERWNGIGRYQPDSLVLASRLVTGDALVSADLGADPADGAGVTLRQGASDVSEYIWLGAEDGRIVLRTRSLDTRAYIGHGIPGHNAGGETRSPYLVPTRTLDAADYRHVRLVRTAHSHQVVAYASTDGTDWVTLGSEIVPMLDATLAGVSLADGSATFTDVTVTDLPETTQATWVVEGDQGAHTVRWTKPARAVSFDVYRSADPQGATTDPQDSPSGWEHLTTTRDLRHDDVVLAGSATYAVVARTLDGTTTTSMTARVDAEGIEAVIDQARALEPSDYTERSWASFVAEVDAVEALRDTDGADEADLVQRVYDAYTLLKPVFRHSFEDDEPDVWLHGGRAPGTYSAGVVDDGAWTGERSLLFTSTDTTGDAGHNVWVKSRKQGGVSPVVAEPVTEYRISFWYQLTDYTPGEQVGAYAFFRSFAQGAGLGTEQRNWLPVSAATEPGEWARFEQTYTTLDGNVDNIEVWLGLRGSEGTFRVDDVTVEPVEPPTLGELLEQARAEDPASYTDESWAAFVAELDRIATAADEPGADEEDLLTELHDAYALLMSTWSHGFEAADADVWQLGSTPSTPGTYTGEVVDDAAASGERSLLFTSTDTTGDAAFQHWAHTRKQAGVSAVRAEPATTYRISFRYQLTDYAHGDQVGAFAFFRSFRGSSGVGTEQRNWLPVSAATEPGEWATFEREYTTVDGDIDSIEVLLGFRGSQGAFRVDDVRVVEVAG
ncbi:hypothetical protein [Isoptericola croceus]|uniref:hypothetical protein n=1 Tax=Isoptericola croceus TaxID=3031406 RepID=UPI0023F8616A|nr:hypothetical protein [Isoptericola croceus]